MRRRFQLSSKTLAQGSNALNASSRQYSKDVRELSRGLHPALLSRGGLRPSLRALARRSPIKVDLELNIGKRPAEPIETAVYYVVSAALTNAAKYSQASKISVTAAVAAVAEALYIVDAQGRIRFLNPTALRILGYDDERQLIGRPSHDTIHYLRPDGTLFPAAECPLLRPRVTAETVRLDRDWFVRQNGSLVAVAYSSAPVLLADGRGAVVSFREVSEPS